MSASRAGNAATGSGDTLNRTSPQIGTAFAFPLSPPLLAAPFTGGSGPHADAHDSSTHPDCHEKRAARSSTITAGRFSRREMN